MTFDDIASRVMDRLNFTSTTARERVEGGVNDANREVTSTLGMITSRQVTNEVTYDPTDVDSTLPIIIVEDVEKIMRVMLDVTDARPRQLDQMTYDDLTAIEVVDGTPKAWAVKTMSAGSVTIVLDAYPSVDEFTLIYDAYDIYTELEAAMDEPIFPASFHDLLVEMVVADELLKLEKPALATIASNKADQRLSDLKMFIAKSAYADYYQGKNSASMLWSRRPFNRWQG